jgi:PAS domain S-box-containing protein
MRSEQNPSRGIVVGSQVLRSPERISAVAGSLLIVLGVLVLAGWWLGVKLLTQVLPAHPTMKPITAVAVCAVGAAILLLRAGRSPRSMAAGRFLAGAAATLGAAVLLEYGVGDLGIDQLLFSDVGTHPGRPSPHTALALLLVGSTLVSLDLRGRGRRLSTALYATSAVVVCAALIGFAYRVDYLRGTSDQSGVAVHTLVALLVALAAIAALRPDRGLVAFLRRDDPGAAVARRLGPAGLAAPFLLGLLAQQAHDAGLIDRAVGLSLVTLLTIGFLVALLAAITPELRAAAEERDDAWRFVMTALESLGEGVVICDADGRLMLFNRELRRIHGLDAADIPPEDWADHYSVTEPVHGQPVAAADMPLIRALEGEVVRGDDLVVTPVGGPPRRITINADPLRGRSGELLGAVATVTDETERRRIEQASRALASIVESSTDAIIGETLEGTITSWNAAAERLYGYTAEEAVGQSVDMLVPAEFREDRAAVMRRVAGAERVERRQTVRVRKDGSRVDVSLTVSPIFDADSRIAGASVIAHDISERARLERMFGQLLEMAPDAVLGIDEDGCIAVANSRVESMFGDARETFVGESVAELLPGLEQARPEPAAPGHAVAVRGRSRDGREFPAEVTLSEVETDQGQLTMAMVRDVSERKRIEDETERLKGEFFGLVSHELRTPLTSIAGYTDLLRDEEGERLTEDGRRYLAIVKRNTERLDHLVRDLLLVGQVEAGTFQIQDGTVDAVAAARDCVDSSAPRAQAAGVELDLTISEPVPLFRGDQERIVQVIDNLISNAIKFTPAGGRVDVQVGARDRACTIEVADTGMGILAADLEHLFDRFYRGEAATVRHIKGVGLGLAITKAIVDQHEGRIEVESEPGEGSAFRIVLPLRPPAPRPRTPDPRVRSAR